jgi:hypothetical protein
MSSISQTTSSAPGKLPEYLWAPEVHEALGEQLTFYFLRTAYSKLGLDEFKEMLKESGLPCFSYLLFGQFDFLARVWGTQDALKMLEEKLKDFSLRFLGDCVPVEVKGICYPWASGKPKAESVKAFCENLRQQTPEGRRQYVTGQIESLKKDHLVVERLSNRPRHPMKAFTVIRNFNSARQSYSLMERILVEQVSAFCNRQRKRDATLYSTRGDIHFIIRWGAYDFRDLVESITRLTATLEREGFAALFETYFRAANVEAEQENPALLREESGMPGAGPVDDASRWAQILPQFKEASEARKALFLHLVRAREFEITPDQVEADKALGNVLGSYFQESVAAFMAFLSHYYSQFETRLRNRILSQYWPKEEPDQSSRLLEWQNLLGRTQPIAVGVDAGRIVPKLSLGELLKLARELRSEVFDPSANRQLEDLIRVRNQLAHGTGAIDFDIFIPFLAQATTCNKILKSLEIQPKLPST